MPAPEQLARQEIDRLLTFAGWAVQDVGAVNLHAAQGVAIREFPLNPGHGFADYLLYVEGKACGVIEAKKQGSTLTGVEAQSARYTQGLPASLPAWRRPLPFSYESTGIETHFTNGLDPAPRARNVFAFHRPGMLAEWMKALPLATVLSTGSVAPAEAQSPPPTCLARLQHMPELVTEWNDFKLWPAQIVAIRNLEASLARNKPRALIQMATGSGKTFTAIGFIYRLIKFAGARRALFLVDRANLGRQAKKEFDAYVSPYNNYKFGEEYIVQHLTRNNLDTTARVTISTIQRMFSMLKGHELADEDDEHSTEEIESLFKQPEPIDYNPAFPIESFDIIVTDEAHRSIYNLWRQVLEYFDAHLIGLTATPNKQTFGFFNQNLVMEYGHEQAVADGVNVNYDVYRIKTEVTEAGAKVEAGYWLEVRDKATRARRDWQLDDDFDYAPEELDRSVQTPDQIRTIARTVRDNWQRDLFPQRQELPKTLVFAKDDNHAETIVQILREEFGRGNQFAQKQRRIVAEIEKQFSRLDEAVANLQRVKADLKNYKTAVLAAAVEGKIVETERERARRKGGSVESSNQLLRRILDTRRSAWHSKGGYVEPVVNVPAGLPDLPGGWAWVPLGLLGSDPFNTVQTGPFGAQLHNTDFMESGVPVIAVGNLTGTGFRRESLYFVDAAKAAQLSRYDVWAGDLLFARSGATLGKVCVAPPDVADWRMTGHILRARLNRQFIDPDVAVYALAAMPAVRRQVFGNVRGVTRPGFNTALLESIFIPVPPLAEQHRIVAEVDRRLSIVREVEAEVNANLKRAQALRQAVLHQAFGG